MPTVITHHHMLLFFNLQKHCEFDFPSVITHRPTVPLVQGPKEDGSVIPQEAEPLRQVGQWLRLAGESIYGTRPWFIQPEDTSEGSTNIRFTTKPDAFYIIAISRPTNGTLTTTAPVPIKEGDKVTLLGGSGVALRWSLSDGVLTVEVGGNELDKIALPAWAFEVSYM